MDIKRCDASELVSMWGTRFEEYSYNNKEFGVLSLHLVIGQLLKYQAIKKKGQRLDLRCNLYTMMDTGSGKSAALDMVCNFAPEVGLNVRSVDSFTDAALLGTIEQKISYNDMNDKIIDYNIAEGILQDADIVHFDEGELLLNTNKNSENAKIYLQKGMNPIGTPSNIIHKKLAHGDPIDIPVEASFYVTSYVPTRFEDMVVNSGFLPRMVLLPKELTIADRQRNSAIDIDYLGESPEYEGSDEEIISYLRQIKSAGMSMMDFSFDGVKPLIKNFVFKMYDIGVNSSFGMQKLYNGFVPRYQNHFYTLCAHHAVMEDRMNVRRSDVIYANSIVYPLMKELLTLLEVCTTQNKQGIQNENLYKQIAMREYSKLSSVSEMEDGWVGAKLLSTAIGIATHSSTTTGQKYMKMLISKGYFEEVKMGNIVVVRPGLRRDTEE